MFLKKSLTLGLIAAIGASPAMAVFDMDATAPVGVTVALETLDGAIATTVGLVAYPSVLNASNALDLTNTVGITVPGSAVRYIRYDLTNAVFGAAPASNAIGFTNVIAGGGTAGSGFVIFQATAAASGVAAIIALSTVSTTKLAVNPTVTAASQVSIKYRVYETLTGASTQSAALVTKAPTKGLVAFKAGVVTTITPATTGNVADVNTDFKKFTGGISTTVALLGQAIVTINSVDANTGITGLIANMVNGTTGTATVTGDFSTANQTFGMATTSACITPTALTINAAKTAATALSVTDLITRSHLCLTIGALNTAAISKNSYTVAVDNKTSQGTTVNDVADKTAVLGSIAHNGTTVQLPYLTTFASYNQRVYMVNRGTSAATYSMTFQPETGTTAVAGTAATGSIPAGATLAVKASDIVTLTGKTRTAATLAIVAATTKVSVATQQINLTDKGTDTVLYDNL